MRTRTIGILAGGAMAAALATTVLAQSASAATISGTVQEAPGSRDMVRLLADVSVRLYMQDTISVLVPLEPSPVGLEMPWPPYVLVDSAVTDVFGRFAFTSRRTGSYQLSFIDTAYQYKAVYVDVRNDTALSVYLLPEGATGIFSGTVTEACPAGSYCLWNPPVPGCTVTVTIQTMVCMMEAQQQAGPVAPTPGEQYTAVTDTQGRYRVAVPVFEPYPCWFRFYEMLAARTGYTAQDSSATPAYDQVVTVDFALLRSALGVAGRQRGAAAAGPARLAADGHRLELDLPRSQNVTVQAFDLTGRQVPGASFSRLLPAGRSTLSLERAAARGVRLVQVQGDGFAETVRLTSARP